VWKWWLRAAEKVESGAMTEVKMVVGLGNPGGEYADTRHNMGFKVIDSLAQSLGTKVTKKKFGARVGESEFVGKKVILVKPWHYMNQSGQPVATAMGFYKLSVSNLMVVSDDMAIEPGRIRIRAKGSAGGHNGLSDIIEKLGTDQFARCRIGIGQVHGAWAVEHVLSEPADEKSLLEDAIVRAREAVLSWIEFGVEKTMNQFNKEQKTEEGE
jgi:PTH1 family peptidyl-tRNA hydrolase